MYVLSISMFFHLPQCSGVSSVRSVLSVLSFHHQSSQPTLHVLLSQTFSAPYSFVSLLLLLSPCSIHFNDLNRIFIIQLMMTYKICKRLSMDRHEMQNVNTTKVIPQTSSFPLAPWCSFCFHVVPFVSLLLHLSPCCSFCLPTAPFLPLFLLLSAWCSFCLPVAPFVSICCSFCLPVAPFVSSLLLLSLCSSIGANVPNPTKQMQASAGFFSRSQQIFPGFSIGKNQLFSTSRLVWEAGTRGRGSDGRGTCVGPAKKNCVIGI